jgi:hypothetical protein
LSTRLGYASADGECKRRRHRHRDAAATRRAGPRVCLHVPPLERSPSSHMCYSIS